MMAGCSRSATRGRMVAIDLRSGERVWVAGNPEHRDAVARGDFLYVVTTDAQVLCIYRRDGGIKWMTPLKAYSDTANKKAHRVERPDPRRQTSSSSCRRSIRRRGSMR